MFESVEARTDARRLESHTISSPWALGSDELKICIDLQWEICCDLSSTFIFEWIFLILAGNKDFQKVWMSLIFRHTHPPATELAALERLKYNCIMLWPL